MAVIRVAAEAAVATRAIETTATRTVAIEAAEEEAAIRCSSVNHLPVCIRRFVL